MALLVFDYVLITALFWVLPSLLRATSQLTSSRLSDNDVATLLAAVDVDGSGQVELEELVGFMERADARDNAARRPSSRGRSSSRSGDTPPSAPTSPKVAVSSA